MGIIARIAARAAGTTALAAALVGMAGTAAYSATPAYANWTLNGTSGTMTIPVTGFPPATFTTDSSSHSIGTGTSTYLSAATPFGAVFGSSQGQQYALLHTAAHLQPSTTTFTFTTPTPRHRWGFTLGDIDADQVTISATDAAGAPVSAAGLGYESGFNYCAVSPRPSGCGAGPYTDQPTWDPDTATLSGNGSDTSGAAAWFRPTVRLKTLTFTFSRVVGLPSYQLWFAAISRDIRGRVRTVSDDTPPPPPPPPPSTTLNLLNTDGTPVRAPDQQPVTTTTASDGSYVFPRVAPARYVVAVVPPPGFAAHGPARRVVDATHADVSGADFTLRALPSAPPSPPAPPGPPAVPVTG